MLALVLRADASPGGRRHRANLTRILDAASALAFEEGVEALSIKRVAALADYTPGALYRYFASKDALVAAIVVRAIDELATTLSTVEATDGVGRLVAQAHAYRAFAEDQPHAFALISSMVGDPRLLVEDEAAVREVFDAVNRVMVPILSAFSEAQSRGQLDSGPVQDRVLVLFAALQGALQLKKSERRAPGIVDARRAFDLMLRVLLRGFGASPDLLALALPAR
jgi:AcrR family transcriptional regulator